MQIAHGVGALTRWAGAKHVHVSFATRGMLLVVCVVSSIFLSSLLLTGRSPSPLGLTIAAVSWVATLLFIERSVLALATAWFGTMLSLGALPVLVIAVSFIAPRARGGRCLVLLGAVITSVIAATALRLYLVGTEPTRGATLAAALLILATAPHLVRMLSHEEQDTRVADGSPGTWLISALHDGLGQRLALLGYQAQLGLISRTDPRAGDRVDGALQGVVTGVEQVVEELHRLISQVARYSPEQFGQGTPNTLTLDALVCAARDAGADVRIVWAEVDELPPEIRDAAEAAAGEGLSNALRHGSTDPIRITSAIDRESELLTVVVRSRIRGLSARSIRLVSRRPPRRSGLSRLEHQILAVNGAMTTYADAGDFVLLATLPTRLVEAQQLTRRSVPVA